MATASLVLLLLIVSTAWTALRRPFSGFFWVRRTGIVTAVFPGTPAAAERLRRGDAILTIDGEPTRQAVRRSIVAYSARAMGESLRLEVLRDGEVRRLSVTYR